MKQIALAAAVVLVVGGRAIPVSADQLNENCTVSVLNRNVQVQSDGTWVLPNIPANQGRIRARVTCVLNGATRFGQSDLFTISVNGSINVPPIALGTVTPIPQSLTISTPNTTLNQAGASTQLKLVAAYPDGTNADVTLGASGTNYTTSNGSVASVSADGLVTAVTSGTALITAFNEGTSGSILIRVGIPPTVTITSPVSGSTVTEGATVPVTATTTGTVASVKFSRDSQVLFTGVTPPYQFGLSVPIGVSGITIGAQADNGFGDIGVAQNVQLKVIPDRLTTVTGSVVDANSVPVAHAIVTELGGQSIFTGTNGFFSIPGARTVFGDIRVNALFTTSTGGLLTGSSAAVPPVPGGITNVGTITIRATSAKVLVAGGFLASDGSPTNTAEVFDLSAGVWSPTANTIPSSSVTGLCAANGAILGNGKVLLAGGGCSDQGITTNAASIYDPASNLWTLTNGMAFGRDQFGMAMLKNGNALAFGGCAGGCSGPNALNQFFSQVGPSAELYNFGTGKWTTVPSLNTARGNLSFGNLYQTVATLLDGRVLACNGSDAFHTSYTSCELYDPVANQWTNVGDLGENGVHYTAVLPTGKVLVVRNDGLSATLFDPVSLQWVATGNLQSRQVSGTLTLLRNGEVLVTGGTDGTNTVGTTQIYNPVTGAWRTTGSMHTVRRYHIAVTLPDGRVLAAGGLPAASGVTPTAEIFDPSIGAWSPTGSLAQARYFANAFVVLVQ